MPVSEQELQALKERLDAGDWLSPPEVANLLGVGRTTVHRWLVEGEIGFAPKGGAGKHRVCDPVDVRRLLAASRTRVNPGRRGDGKPLDEDGDPTTLES